MGRIGRNNRGSGTLLQGGGPIMRTSLLLAALLASTGCSTNGRMLDPRHSPGAEVSPEHRDEEHRTDVRRQRWDDERSLPDRVLSRWP